MKTHWQLARLESPDHSPEDSEWIAASVPGAVQLDWAAAKGLPDINYGENVTAYDGLEDFFWLYRTQLPEICRPEGERLLFRCGGVDYQCEVRLDGRVVTRSTGLNVPFSVDVSSAAPGSWLEILIHPAPKRHIDSKDRTQADHVTKPAVSYGWDWHPRLIPLGIHTETDFERLPSEHLQHVNFEYELSADFSSASIHVTAETSVPELPWTWHLLDPDGVRVLEATEATATLTAPRLWWPHDHGEQPLYTLVVALSGSGHTLKRRVGFRRVRLVMHEGAWRHPSSFPKSRSHPPITLELNGRIIFAKGSNWVNPDIFPGRVTKETLSPLLQLAKETHFNILRCWGGAPAQSEPFFDLCDELGLLVWQEFPLACNPYPDTSDYLEVLDADSRALIRRVRTHPSLALWSGGNELFNSWSGMTDQSLPLRLLNRNCYDLDPSTPFIPTSPLDGIGHGDYRFRDEHGRDIFQIFQSADCTAYTEFGCPGPSPADYLRTFIPEQEIFPPRPGGTWTLHHAFGAWDMDATSWICLDTLKNYFGEFADLEALVAAGEWLQCEGYKSVFEEARRQKPKCSMALNWCFNEAWPCAANNSLINWPHQPKPALFAVREACRPMLASARIPTFEWKSGEAFVAEIWLLNDSPNEIPAGELHAEVRLGDSRQTLLRWDFPTVPAGNNLSGPSVRWMLPHTPSTGEFALTLEVGGRPELRSSYRLRLRPSLAKEDPANKPRALNV